MGYGNKSTKVIRVDVTEDVKSNMDHIENFSNQIDFVEMIRESHFDSGEIMYKVLGDRFIQFLTELNGGYYLKQEIEKDDDDDYMKYREASIGKIREGYVIKTEHPFDSNTGAWVTNYPPSYYTKEIGATVTFTFEGTGVGFAHYTDDRGGIWEWEIDGEVVGETTTHRNHLMEVLNIWNSSQNYYYQTIATGLSDGPHTVVGTFKGIDERYPLREGETQARGWLNGPEMATHKSFQVLTEGQEFEESFQMTVNSSNKEVALSHSIKDANGDFVAAKWIPDHGVGTVFAGNQQVLIDGNPVTDWTTQYTFSKAKSIQVVQDMICEHPTDPANKSAELLTVHNFTSKGTHIKGKIKALREIQLSGYVLMFPIMNSFCTHLVTSYKNKYATGLYDTKTSTLLSEKFNAKSYAYINDSDDEKGNFMACMTVHDIKNSFRFGKENREETSAVWLQHRNEEMDKLYPHIFDGYVMDMGETFSWSGTFHFGYIPYINKLIK